MSFVHLAKDFLSKKTSELTEAAVVGELKQIQSGDTKTLSVLAIRFLQIVINFLKNVKNN